MGANLRSFHKLFPDEQACITFLEKSRWPDGKIQSPYGDRGAFRITTRPGVYKCRLTRRQFSIRQGTIFEESRLPLTTWFFAIFMMQSNKKGISSINLAHSIGVTQKTAWFMLHRVRYGTEHKNYGLLQGVVEIDEHYSGGKARGKRGRGAANKTPIFGMVERGGEVRVQVVPDCKRRTLLPIIKRSVAMSESTSIMTDDYSVYDALDTSYRRHVINHSKRQYVRAGGYVHTNTIEGFWSHLKLGLKAVQISVRPKHLNRYCKEYEFKYNTRKLTNFERFSRWFDCCKGRLTYRQLTA